jgi:hypothetical protein
VPGLLYKHHSHLCSAACIVCAKKISSRGQTFRLRGLRIVSKLVSSRRTYFRSCEEDDLKLAASLFEEFQQKRSEGSEHSLILFGFFVMRAQKLKAYLAI